MIVIFLLSVITGRADAQTFAVNSGTPDEDFEEVPLSFNNLRSVKGEVYVTGLFERKTGRVYLPVGELFHLLEIHHTIHYEEKRIEGFYLDPDRKFRLDFDKASVTYRGRSTDYNKPSLFQIRERDYYIAPAVFEDIFGMGFDIDMSTLSLRLQADEEMPVIRRQKRIENRRVREPAIRPEYYPLRHGRRRAVLRTGFLDYSLNARHTLNEDRNFYNIRFSGGAELLGGDLQGSHYGSYTPSGEWIRRTRNLRWRYVFRETPGISRISAGQIRSSGLQPRGIRGISVSNDPIEPRRVQGSHVIEGTVEPNSEVELYFNNMLIDYAVADGSGDYRFDVPLRYGTTRLRTEIYTPGGRMYREETRIRIPYRFLPAGDVTYHLEAGEIERDYFQYFAGSRMAHGNVSVGVTEGLTVTGGTEYIEQDERPLYYGGLATRIFSQYLVNLDIAPGAFHRVQGSVMYPSSRSVSAGYTGFTGPSIYNTRGVDHHVDANLYTPFRLGSLRAGIRIGGEHLVYRHHNLTRFTGNVYFRISRLNLRMNYRDDIHYTGENRTFGAGLLRSSATYTFPRNGSVPQILKGAYLRTSMMVELNNRRLRQGEIQVAKRIFGNGRIYIGGSRNFRTGLSRVQAGITVDLGSRVRAATDYRSTRNSHTFRQHIRGSVGLDDTSRELVFSSRELTGRAGASVVLFIDKNDSGEYDEETDEVLPYKAVRLDRYASMQIGNDGFLRLSHLQSYYRYNLEVIREAIPNPLVVPRMEQFSFVADPNQYKRIEIPFYRTGVVEGTVFVERDSDSEGAGGIRLHIFSPDSDYRQTVRTFRGGEFYVTDLPPGRYRIEPDSGQLDRLNLKAGNGAVEFEIRPAAEGDFVEDVEIVLVDAGE